MKRQRYFVLLLAVALSLVLALPVAAEGGRNAIIGQSWTLSPGESVNEDVLIVSGRAHLQPGSLVEGNLVVLAGEAVIEGHVTGDVVSIGGSLELHPSAVIDQDVVAIGQMRRDPAAQIKGNVVEGLEEGRAFRYLSEVLQSPPNLASGPVRPVSPPRLEPAWLAALLRSIMGLVALVAAAVLLVTIWPNHLERIEKTMRVYALHSLGLGLLTGVVLLILSPILILTCLGIPLAIALLIGALLSGMIAWVAAGRLVGRKLFLLFSNQPGAEVAETLVGVLAIGLLSMVPCLGKLASAFIVAWGVGATLLTRFGTQSYPALDPFVHAPTPTTHGASPLGEGDTSAPSSRQSDTRRLDQRLDLDGPEATL